MAVVYVLTKVIYLCSLKLIDCENNGMYKFGRKKKTPEAKNIERKNIEGGINAASVDALHV